MVIGYHYTNVVLRDGDRIISAAITAFGSISVISIWPNIASSIIHLLKLKGSIVVEYGNLYAFLVIKLLTIFNPSHQPVV